MRDVHARYLKSLFTNIQKQYKFKLKIQINLLFKKFTNFTGNNSRIFRIKNAKFLGYCFYINTNI